MAALRRFLMIAYACFLAEGCVGVIRTSYPPGAVAVRRADADGHVWVTQRGWFTVLFPSAPKVGRRVFPTSYGPMRMKTLSSVLGNSSTELYYFESQAPISDVESMLHKIHDNFVHTPGVRAVDDERVTRGSWNGIALRLLLAPHSEMNRSRFALDMRVLIFAHSHRFLMLITGGGQGDANAAATALAITDSLRFAR